MKQYRAPMIAAAIALLALGWFGYQWFHPPAEIVDSNVHVSTQDSKVQIEHVKDSTQVIYRTRLVKVQVPTVIKDSARGFVTLNKPCPEFAIDVTIPDTSGGYATLVIDRISCDSQLVRGIHVGHSPVTVQVTDSEKYAILVQKKIDNILHSREKDSTVTIREHEAWAVRFLISDKIVSDWSINSGLSGAAVGAQATYNWGEMLSLGVRPIIPIRGGPEIYLDAAFTLFRGWRR